MSSFKKMLAFFCILLTLLFSVQAYTDSCFDLEIDSNTGKGLEFHEAKYDLIASFDQKQSQEKSPNSNVILLKYTRTDIKAIPGGLTSKDLISIYRYYSNSGTIFINLTSFILVFPFHFFG
jgi:hypothetical protein